MPESQFRNEPQDSCLRNNLFIEMMQQSKKMFLILFPVSVHSCESLNGIFPNINFFPKMPGGSMGHGFSYQLVMERCRQLSETDTKEKKRKTRRIAENINVNDDSSGKGYFSF